MNEVLSDSRDESTGRSHVLDSYNNFGTRNALILGVIGSVITIASCIAAQYYETLQNGAVRPIQKSDTKIVQPNK